MGNKLGRRKQVVDEKYTRPRGLYQHMDVDMKKLRKLILGSKLAPCYPGDEECSSDLEECPICFLYYPSLNRSKCCTKGVCTECFLQMKVPNSMLTTQCPFCKTSNYEVEYWGVKSKEEKGIEQIEEQLVIEAKIRMRQRELQDDEERMKKKQDLSSCSRSMVIEDIECSLAGAPFRVSHAQGEEVVSDVACAPSVSRCIPPLRSNRDDEFDLDLEEIMVMEAIWLSIQESRKESVPGFGSEPDPTERYFSKDHYTSTANAATLSSAGGLACAIAALAEHQQMSGESSLSCIMDANLSQPTYNNPNMLLSCRSYYPPGGPAVEISQTDGEWNVERGSDTAEAGTSYQSSNSMGQDSGITDLPQQGEEVQDESFQSLSAPIFPEIFEEEMVLEMAVPLAEVQAVTNGPGVMWH